MRFHIISLPFDAGKESFDTHELDAFCAHVRIISFQCSSIQVLGKAYWSIFFCYEALELKKHTIPKKEKASAELNAQESRCFQDLKSWRNEKAIKEGYPPYIIANNSLLEQMVQRMPDTISGLMDLHGFGKQKAAKYGKDILAILNKYKES